MMTIFKQRTKNKEGEVFLRKKLFALNLALFMIILSVLPVSAMQNNKEEDVFVEQQSYDAQYNMIALKEQIKNEQLQTRQERSEGNEIFGLYTSRSAGYEIDVDGNSFSSLYDAKGNGWEYQADGNILFLNGYNGSSIRASGDLVIYAEGVNKISGSTSTYYGSDGIISSGNLDVIIVDGTTSVSGGNGFYRGGDGIYSDSYAFVYTFAGTSLIVEGGNTAQISAAGGNAIYGEIAHISGEGFVRAIGGDGTSLYSNGCAGGCALIGNEVYVESPCELIGGEGYYAGPGIYFGSYCETGVVNATISCGNGQYNKYAIQNSDGLSWYYNDHTIVSGDSYSIRISIRQYILNLFGCGGTRGTATFESLKAYYPTSYDLSEYSFQRTGYTQVGWSTTAGDLVPLDLYTPDEDTDLYAEWAPNTYKVAYNSNGGSGSMSSSTHTYDIAKNLTSCKFSKEGYVFVGWATSPNGSVEYSDGASIKNLTSTNGGAVTLYAVWEKIPTYTQINKIAQNSYSVELFNVDSSCTVILATYQQKKLVEAYPQIYNGNKLLFTTTKEFDTMKVIVWSNLNNLIPICEANTTIIE